MVWGVALAALASTPSVVVPAGVYRPFFAESVGDGGFAPPRPVAVSAFKLDVRQVTVREYLEFVGANPSWQRGRLPRVFADRGYLASWEGALSPPRAALDAPVTEVSWFAARAYCKWKGGRLPTTAEWELAAQEEGTARQAVNEKILAWYAEPTRAEHRAAGSGAPNRYGLRDLHGLVWEWVVDFNEALWASDVRDENGKELRLFCGGGAGKAADPGDYAAYMRFAFRSSLNASYTVRTLGFRCAGDAR